MKTYAKLVSRKEIEPNLFELQFNIYNSGSCQCFKDCNCYEKKGELLGTDIRYSNGIVINDNNKERTYNSIKGCKDSLESYLNKHLKL